MLKVKPFKKIASGKTVFAFFVTLSLCSLLTALTVFNRIEVERLTTEQIITQKGIQISDVISKLLYKAHTLSALVIQNNGMIEDFERVANTIVDDPAILNVLIAPGGVVSDVFPLKSNEAVIGLNFFSEGAGNKEAVLAKELGELVFGGPFDLMQGGQAIVGRLPIFLKTMDEDEFWGLVSVTLKYPQALNGAGLDSLQSQGLAYELWRINPDDNEKQIIANSSYAYKQNANYVERKITISNAEWYLRILPIRSWYEYSETWVLTFISAVLCFLVSFVVNSNEVLNRLKTRLEVMASVDSLTGIHNRRFFMEFAPAELEKASRKGTNAFIIMFDLDHFKLVNDQYGHLVGDTVLIDVSHKVKGMMRPYDLFARYGGEEFIILVSDITEDDVINLAERFRKRICETPVLAEGNSVSVSASFGIAPVDKTYDIDKAIHLADDALYQAKDMGRNRVVFSPEPDYVTP